MSNQTPGPEFWNRVSAIVNLSNDQCDTAVSNEVAASTMYASARFSAFIVAQSTGNADNMRAEKEHALDYFTDQFRKMMAENIDDFAQNFDKYMAPVQQP